MNLIFFCSGPRFAPFYGYFVPAMMEILRMAHGKEVLPAPKPFLSSRLNSLYRKDGQELGRDMALHTRQVLTKLRYHCSIVC